MSQRIAFVAVPPVDDLYPWTQIWSGIHAAGYFPTRDGKWIDKADALVTWSPWNGSLRQALVRKFEARRKPVIVLENGWLSPVPGGPMAGEKMYQAALGGWNGTGRYSVGSAARWASLGLGFDPWQTGGGRALIIGQKGGPDDPRTAAKDWHENALPGRPAIRRGPGTTRPLAADLAEAGECHVWTSNAASLAVLAGIPVIQHGPNLMVSELASRPGEALRFPERKPVFERLAWAQFTGGEIESGEPFARLLALVS